MRTTNDSLASSQPLRQDGSQRFVGILLGALLLTGCVANPTESTRQLPEVIESSGRDNGAQTSSDTEADPSTTATDQQTSPERTGQPSYATLALLDRSERLRLDGDIPAAIATVERAIRLDPNNPALWLELGQLQLSAGKDAQAEQLVRKSIALVRDDPQTEREAWLTLADINEARGNVVQARELRRRWRSGPG